MPAQDPITKQLAFDLAHQRAFGRADFVVSAVNAAALEWIDRWPRWPSPVLLLHGPQGAGKTHLAHLWCERSGAFSLPGNSLDDTCAAAVLDRRRANIVVDDAQHSPEAALLHMFNACVETGANLLLTCRERPSDWPIALPDLASRLRSVPSVGIGGPDDVLLGALLAKHFADRQLLVAPGVIAYLVRHIERSYAAAAAMAAALDKAALDRDCAVTIRLASQVIAACAG